MLTDIVDALKFGALLRMSLDYSGDEVYQVVDGEDVLGVRFEDAQIWASATIGPFDMHIMAASALDNAFPVADDGTLRLSEASLGSLEVLDAWVRTDINEDLDFYAGQFHCPLVASANVGYEDLIMIDRTRLGQLFTTPGAYQPGAALMFDNEQFHAKLVLQNGADGIIDEFGFVARGEYKVNGGAGHREGALGSSDDLQATIGVGYFSDGSDIGGSDFGSSWAVDLYSTLNAISLHAELAGMDEELATRALGNASDDATPYSATAGYRINEHWEAAVRWQDLDDDLETTLLGGGVNYYIRGHDLKVQLNVSNYDSNGDDGTIVQLGLAVAVGEKP